MNDKMISKYRAGLIELLNRARLIAGPTPEDEPGTPAEDVAKLLLDLEKAADGLEKMPYLYHQAVVHIFICPVALFNQYDHGRAWPLSPLHHEIAQRGGRVQHIDSNLEFNRESLQLESLFGDLLTSSRVVITFDSTQPSQANIAGHVIDFVKGAGFNFLLVDINLHSTDRKLMELSVSKVYEALFLAMSPMAEPPPGLFGESFGSDKREDEVLGRLREMHVKLDQVLSLTHQTAMRTSMMQIAPPPQWAPTPSDRYNSNPNDWMRQSFGGKPYGGYGGPGEDRLAGVGAWPNRPAAADMDARSFGQPLRQRAYGFSRPDPRPNPTQPMETRKTDINMKLISTVSIFPMDDIEQQAAEEFFKQGEAGADSTEVLFGDGERIQRSFILYQAIPNEQCEVAKFLNTEHPLEQRAGVGTAIVLYDADKAQADESYRNTVEELAQRLRAYDNRYEFVYALQLSQVHEHLQATHRGF